MPHIRRPSRLLFAAACGALAFALAGCGSDDDDNDGAAAAPPPVVTAPQAAASFSAPASAAAGQVVVFDANASTASDGSALSYAWDFGDGLRGGGKTIARSFGAGGARSVTLTVVDGAGQSATLSRVLTIAAPSAAAGTVVATGRVAGLDGVAIEGVAAAVVGAGAAGAAATDAAGKVVLTLPRGAPLTVKLSKAGFSDQFVSLTLPAAAGADAGFTATMRPRDAAQTLADAAAGGTLAGRNGASLVLPAGALVNAAGTAASGPIQVSITPVDVTLPGAGGFPGSFDGIRADGTTTPIASFGVTEFVLSAGSEQLQLAPGRTATIEVPIYAAVRPDGSALAAGDTTPLWSLDESTSMWIQEGTGTVVASAGSPSGLAMRATVSHLSWWNSDIGFEPYGPQPKCVYDTDSGVPGGNDTFATATICNMLAEFDRGPGAGGAAARGRAAAVRPLAQRAPPNVAGYSRTLTIPIAGGDTLPVPASYDIVLSGSILGGTFAGRTVINGAVGVREVVLVKLRPIGGTGPLPEAVTAPFDATRALQTGQTALYTFSAADSQFARITVSDANGSTLVGRVRLLQGASALGSAGFGPGTGSIVAALPGAGSYTVELSGVANTPGAYRLQVELLGGRQSETLPFAFDASRTLPDFTRYSGSFSVAAPSAGSFAFQNQRSVAALVRLAGPDGATLLNSTVAGGATSLMTVPLPATGTYRVEASWADARGGSFRITGEPTLWLPVAPGLDVASFGSTIDLVADRNGKPVVGFMQRTVVGQSAQVSIALRRWTGAAWENAASDLVVTGACSNSVAVRFAFDSANNPVVVYGHLLTADGFDDGDSFTNVRRFVGGAWQPVGPNDGTLPGDGSFGIACRAAPSIAIDAADRPVVAYRTIDGSAKVTVKRFDGTAWLGLAGNGAGADSFDAPNGGGIDLRFDPADQLYFVLSNRGSSGSGPTTVRRFEAAPGGGSWLPVGPNGGALPETNTSGLDAPQIRFAAADRPVVGSFAGVGQGGTTSPGVAVHRFDGSVWSSTGGYQTGPDNYAGNGPAIAFALSGGDALVAWTNATRETATRGPSTAPVVQRNTGTGWSAVGPGAGEVPQYTSHGLTPLLSAFDERLLQTGSDLYLTLIAQSPESAGGVPTALRIVLLRKTGN